MTKELDSILTACGTKSDFKKWLIENRLFETEDVALQAAEEAQEANPTPIMRAMNHRPTFALWDVVERIIWDSSNTSWMATIGFEWPAEANGPEGWSVLHIAANKEAATKESILPCAMPKHVTHRE